MPYAEFGEKLSFGGGSTFFKLKSKGDKLRFRLLGAPFIEGKHFFKLEDGSWDIQPCPRVNESSKCPHCDIYFSIIMKAKKTGDKTVMEQARKEAAPYKNSIAVYFPVLDRETEEFKIFQSSISVRNKIEDEVALGTKVLDVDFIVLRTENPGTDYYKLSRVDSSDTKKLSANEKAEVERFKTINLADIVAGVPDEAGVAFEANSEVAEDFADNV